MIKIFTNKSIWQKIAIVLVIVLLFQFVVNSCVPIYAEDDTSSSEESTANEGNMSSLGGVLLKPIVSFVMFVGDGLMGLLHSVILGQQVSKITIDTTDQGFNWGVLVVVAIIGLASSTPIGWAIGAIAALGFSAYAMVTFIEGANGEKAAAVVVEEENMPDEFVLPIYSYSPEEIFQGRILLFNVNFFEDGKTIYYQAGDGTIGVYDSDNEATIVENHDGIEYYFYYEDENDPNSEKIATSPSDSAQMLKSTISSWYNTIRNICLVLMLSVLVYIGIRMILTSVAADKAKYKTMIMDWFIGLCLLFLMHYIMAFSVTLVQKLTEVVNTSVDKNQYLAVIYDKNDAFTRANEDEFGGSLNISDGYLYYQTNLMGQVRIQMQLTNDIGTWIAYVVIFWILLIFTIIFTFIYLKRLLYMAFLTLIAPVVALTYCIDKLNDGQAQGFNRWFREYIFNLLIQPMHLLLYFILVTSAFELAASNVLYSIVALAFMFPAEKLLRSLFGFEKAQTPSLLTGAAGTALMMSGMSKLAGAVKPKVGKGDSSKGDNDKENSAKTNKFPNVRNPVDSSETMLAADNEDNNEENLDKEQNALNEMRGMDLGGQYGPLNPEDEKIYDELQRELNEKRAKQQANSPNIDSSTLRTDSLPQDSSKGNTTKTSENSLKNRFKNASNRVLKSGTNAIRIARPKTLERGKKFVARSAKSLGKTALQGAIGAPVALAAGGVGLAAGLALGDPSKAVAFTTAGLGLGASVGEKGQSVVSDVGDDYVKAFKDSYHGKEYEQKDFDKYVDDFTKDAKLNIRLEEEFGKDKAKQMIDNGTVEGFVKNGIDDIEDIVVGAKGIDEGVFNNIDHASATIQTDKRMGSKDPSKMGKERADWEKALYNDYIRAGAANEQQARRTVNKTMEKVQWLHKNKRQ